MSEHTKTPWKMSHNVCGVGAGFNDHIEKIVDENGKVICSSTMHFATEFTAYADDDLRESYRTHTPWRKTFEKGGQFPHSANAEFIVRACNAHEELVAALERLLTASFDSRTGIPAIDETLRRDMRESQSQAAAALAKARS